MTAIDPPTAAGSWIGAYLSLTFLNRPPPNKQPPVGLSPQ